MEKETLNKDLERLIEEAQSQPGIAELMAVYGQLNEVYLASQQYLYGMQPRTVVSSSTDTC